jgi:hypothetical protein
MSIEKKSLISTLKTAKKANVASASTEGDVKGSRVESMRVGTKKISLKSKKYSLKSKRFNAKAPR